MHYAFYIILGVIAVADTVKEDSPEAVLQLKNMGVHTVMLTGDNERTARAIGNDAGVDNVAAGVLPDGKEAVIRMLQESGTVVVKVWVDQYGRVKLAEPGADGTTVTNSKHWAAARAVAMEACFDTKADAPALQEGTITYIFKLK